MFAGREPGRKAPTLADPGEPCQGEYAARQRGRGTSESGTCSRARLPDRREPARNRIERNVPEQTGSEDADRHSALVRPVDNGVGMARRQYTHRNYGSKSTWTSSIHKDKSGLWRHACAESSATLRIRKNVLDQS